MLFTSNINKSFQDTDCSDVKFGYTPLSAIDVHWTYKKGDKTIDMGYINVEFLRKNLLDIFEILDTELLDLDEFSRFYSLATEAEEGDQVLHIATSSQVSSSLQANVE